MFTKKLNISFFLIISFFLLLSCRKESPEPIINDYSFFVAGHSYGKAGVDNLGLHPPFEQKFEFLNDRNVSLGFLTGDIVNISSEKNWNEVDSVLRYLDADVHFVVGNHDLKVNDTLFEFRYGRTYSSFIKYGDLFILLDPNKDHWNISGEQLAFLRETLQETDQIRHIFVFFHQLLWWSKHNKYRYVRMNSTEGRADTINFWSEVVPLFTQLNKPITMFAGDMGAAGWSDIYMYDVYQNITFIGSGMGYGVGDNIVIIHALADGSVNYELIALNGDDIHALGKLEDYVVPTKPPLLPINLFQGD
jgi:predicted MPP superfamily phosphohydrolase